MVELLTLKATRWSQQFSGRGACTTPRILKAFSTQNHTSWVLWLGQNTGEHGGRSQAMYVQPFSSSILLQLKEGLFLTSIHRIPEERGAILGFQYSHVIQLCSEPSPASYTTLHTTLSLLQIKKKKKKYLHWKGELCKPPWQSEIQGKHQAGTM